MNDVGRLLGLHEALRAEAIDAERDAADESDPGRRRYCLGMLDGLAFALSILADVIDECQSRNVT